MRLVAPSAESSSRPARVRASWIVALGLVVGLAPGSAAGFTITDGSWIIGTAIYEYSGTLDHTGFVDPNAGFEEPGNGCDETSCFYEESDWFPLSGALEGSGSVMADVDGLSFHFGTAALMDGDFNGGHARGVLDVTLGDTIILDGPVGTTSFVTVHWLLEGNFHVGSESAHLGALGGAISMDLDIPGGDIPADPSLEGSYAQQGSFDVPLSPLAPSGSFEIHIASECRTPPGGFPVGCSFTDNTLTITSVLLPDGSTPESQGMSLGFASGVPSPNLAVPGPGASVLLIAGLGGALAFGLRRPR